LAAVVLAGLTINDVVRTTPPRIEVIDVKDPSPPDPKPEEVSKPEFTEAAKPIVTRVPPIDFVIPRPINPPIVDPVIDHGPISLPPVDFGSGNIQTVEPARATPRNNPGRWVTDDDYRSRWIREERSGTASFILEITANGRVSDCEITRSTGHAVLDKATCSLITKRARFQPATDTSGAAISSSYSSSIRWVLPD
jgi:protein TonB